MWHCCCCVDLLQMKYVTDAPVHDLLNANLWTNSADERKEALDAVTKDIWLNYVDVMAHNDPDADVIGDGVKE